MDLIHCDLLSHYCIDLEVTVSVLLVVLIANLYIDKSCMDKSRISLKILILASCLVLLITHVWAVAKIDDRSM